MKILPVVFVWSEGRMVPLARYANVCARQFVDGEEYPLAVLEARSRASHSHYFATLHDIWMNLPEDQAKRFPTEEHMRKWALVEAGYAVMKEHVCQTPKHARSLAAFIRSVDTYGVIRISGNVVQIFDAQSQSASAMGREAFQDSKQKVIDICSALTGATSAQFKKEASRRVPPEKLAKPAPQTTSQSSAEAPPMRLADFSGTGALDRLPDAPAGAAQPKTGLEYVAHAARWIDAASDHKSAQDRFDSERSLRDVLKVPVGSRVELQNKIDAKFG